MGFKSFIALYLAFLIVFAAAQTLTVKTDKEVYKPGDVVRVEIKGRPKASVGVEIRDPGNRLVFVDQIRLDGKGFGSCLFELSNFSVLGVYTVYVASPGEFAKCEFTVVEKTFENATAFNVVFVLVDSAGNAVRGAYLRVDDREYYSDEGVFSILLDKGEYHIVVLKDGVVVYEGDIVVEASRVYKLELSLYCVKVMVQDFLGRPVEGGEVKLLKEGVEVGSEVTDEAGVAVFRFLKRGVYELEVGDTVVTVNLEDNSVLTVRLKPPWFLWAVVFIVLTVVFYFAIRKLIMKTG